ncbi:ribonuclease MC-like [Argentina anserina]|uniref:ribonuclease MC-like n=1 Tax=Argentina anserina TaxID=57926 RepID=UPI0021762975|nr:ribonuclease MC-like [Potentilla anserina]
MAIVEKWILAVFISTICLKGASIHTSKNGGVYQYFQLVQQWPPNRCLGKQKPCFKVPQVFTIHGLWPSNHTNNNLQHSCKGSTFPSGAINGNQTLLTQLMQAWPNVETGNDEWFWKSEWYNHGTCSEQTYTSLEYFRRSLEIHKSFNITDILVKGGVISGAQYQIDWNSTDVESMIQAKTKFLPLLRCRNEYLLLKGGNQIRGPLLFEISLCYDYKGIDMINCTSAYGVCPQKLYF